MFKLLSEGLRMIVTQMPARGTPTSGFRLLTSRTQTPAGIEGSPTVAAPGRVREDRAPGRAGTVSPAGGRSTERGETSQQQANSGSVSQPAEAWNMELSVSCEERLCQRSDTMTSYWPDAHLQAGWCKLVGMCEQLQHMEQLR